MNFISFGSCFRDFHLRWHIFDRVTSTKNHVIFENKNTVAACMPNISFGKIWQTTYFSIERRLSELTRTNFVNILSGIWFCSILLTMLTWLFRLKRANIVISSNMTMRWKHTVAAAAKHIAPRRAGDRERCINV